MPATPLPKGVTRLQLPFGLVDLIKVTDPGLIRKLETSPDLTRAGESPVHPILSLFFKSTKFYNSAEDSHFVALLDDHRPDVQQRINLIRDKMSEKHSEQVVRDVSAAVHGSGSQIDVARACLRFIAPLFLRLDAGEDVPDNIIRASIATHTTIMQSLNPFSHWRAIAARRELEDYIAARALPGVSHTDAQHITGVTCQSVAEALLRLRNKGEEVTFTELLLAMPINETSPRVPLRETTLGGLFSDPLVPGRTIVQLQIGEAAKQTGDVRFLFGSGVDERQCLVKPFLFSIADDVAKCPFGSSNMTS